jgi:hypothetical protein
MISQRTHGHRRSPRALTAVYVALVGALMMLALAGCSEDPPPGEAVPELATSLDKIDAAIEAGELAQARQAVEDLVAETAQARVDGDISDEQADQIFEAAHDVLAQLPDRRGEDSEGEASAGKREVHPIPSARS